MPALAQTADEQPSDVPLEPPGNATPEQPPVQRAPDASQAPAAAATLHVVLFTENTPLAGAQVGLSGADAAPAATDGNGSARLVSSQAGKFRLWVQVPRASLPQAPVGDGPLQVELDEVALVVGETVEVLVTLGSDGKLTTFNAEGVEGTSSTVVEEAAEVPDQPAVLGTIAGQALDQEKNLPVAGARVFVRGSGAEATTDADGRFTLELPVGKWTVSVIHPNYTTLSQPDIEVAAEAKSDVRFELLPASVELEDFVITVPHIAGSVASVMNERRESAALSDAISAEDISKTPAGDAAGAAQRVVGVTVVDGKFVYVRGLGERYTNSLLNGSPMPSPEPDKATVPLDLLPTQVIRSIDIAKTATPDFPADFAGGSVRIETITVPEDTLFAVSLKTGYNSQASFERRAAFPGSPTDWLGFDDGRRQLPETIPTEFPLKSGSRKPDGERVNAEDLTEAGLALNSPMGVHYKDNLPNLGGSIIAGDGWNLSEDTRLGALASFTYSRKSSLRRETIREFNLSGQEDELSTWIDATATTATDSVRWGAFGSVALSITEHHEVSLIGLRSQLADHTTRLMDLFRQNNDGRYQGIRNEFTSRSLEFTQARGVHQFPALNDAEFDWRLSLSRAALDQPDMRDTYYFRGAASEAYSYSPSGDSGRHFFADMDENARSGFVDYTQPLVAGELEKKLKIGGGLNNKERSFATRRFSFGGSGGAAGTCGAEFDPARCPRELFTDENIESGALRLVEETQSTDAYDARTNIYAGYALADVKFFEPLRFIAGVRVEQTDQTITGRDQFDPDAERQPVDLQSFDTLPSASVVYAVAEWIELRGAASKTLARPQLREMAPFQFADYAGGVLVNGNSNLTITKIINADLRVDVFPTPAEVISLSVFAKDFTDPIEPVLQPTGSGNLQSFQNAEGGFLYGVELEARKGLEFLSPALSDFSIMGNLTLATSQIEVTQTGGDTSGIEFITNPKRPMVNQAPYVINLALDYDGPTKTQMRLLYNVSGRSVAQIGTNGLDDTYLQPRHLLDFTFFQQLGEGLKLGASVENILNAPFEMTQGPDRRPSRVVYGYRSGVTASVQLGYTY